MVKCPFCSLSNIHNTIFCEHCGFYLVKNENRETDPLEVKDVEVLAATGEEAEDTSTKPTDEQVNLIHLRIGTKGQAFEIPLEQAVHLGRIDPAEDIFPEVDLTQYAPAKQISRRHARILKQDEVIFVEDLGSINGTFVNGKILIPYLLQPLKNGDILQLGELPIEVHFPT